MINSNTLSSSKSRYLNKDSTREKIAGYLFITPFILYFIIFQIGPMVIGFIYSLTKWNMRAAPKFVGLQNYVRLLFDDLRYPLFWTSLEVTFKYIIITIPLALFFSFLLAILVNRAGKFEGLFKVLYYIPVVTSGIAVAAMWQWILDSHNGLLNNIILALPFIGEKIGRINWLNDTSTALPVIAVMAVWQSAGFNILIYLAGLKGISKELYESAEIDGARLKDRVLKITLPLLKPTFFFLIVTNTITGLQVFDQMYVLTSGGPQNSTYTYVLGLYNHATKYSEMGIASAMGYILFFITLIITYINFKLVPQNYE